MGEQVLDVVLEAGDNCRVCVELHCVWRQGRFGAGNVEACPAEEDELPAVVVILTLSAIAHNHEGMP